MIATTHIDRRICQQRATARGAPQQHVQQEEGAPDGHVNYGATHAVLEKAVSGEPSAESRPSRGRLRLPTEWPTGSKRSPGAARNHKELPPWALSAADFVHCKAESFDEYAMPADTKLEPRPRYPCFQHGCDKPSTASSSSAGGGAASVTPGTSSKSAPPQPKAPPQAHAPKPTSAPQPASSDEDLE